MENNIQTFTNVTFGALNVIMIDDEPWFIGKEVAEKLEFRDYRDALDRHVDKNDRMIAKKSELANRGKIPLLEKVPNRGLTIINESGLYSLVMRSKLKEARRFQRWVTSEVLPSIRKHGAYMTPETIEKALYNPDFIMDLAKRLKDEQEKNAILAANNTKLATANKVLTGEISAWDWRECVDALVRSYAARRLENDFQWGWNAFYKNFNYKMGVNLRSRERKRGKTLMDCIKPCERNEAVRIAAAMCQRANIDVGDILNEENLRKFGVEA